MGDRVVFRRKRLWAGFRREGGGWSLRWIAGRADGFFWIGRRRRSFCLGSPGRESFLVGLWYLGLGVEWRPLR